MEVKQQIYALMTLSPISGLLLLGAWVTLRSGLSGARGIDGLRRLAWNASHAVALVAFCLFLLAVLQHVVGFHTSLM